MSALSSLPQYFPLNPDRLGPRLSSCGFTRHLIGDYAGAFGARPAIVHLAHPRHTVAVTEQADPNDPNGRVYTELTVFRPEMRHVALCGGPVERVHAQVFDVTFGSATPAAVIHAAAVAALTMRLRSAVTR